MKRAEKINLERISAKAVSLVGLVSYQDDSIVSRTIVDKETGTITLFAFDEGQGLSEHTVPFDALVYIVDGEADVVVASNKLHLKQGEMTIMPANKPHAVRAPKRFKMLLIMIR
jgi:quercetin dioxygenase-like cupin family protein